MSKAVAVLASGGLDSCVLLASKAEETTVTPLYVRHGLIWEEEELKALGTFIKALNHPHVQPIIILSQPIHSIYENHWSITGQNVPSKHDPDSKTYLPGRNILLLSIASIWCSLHKVSRIAIGSLSANPFPDATLDFFREFGKSLSTGLASPISIEAPFCEKNKKEDLIRQFSTLPLELSLSCMSPKKGLHCGECNKCYERQVGFKRAGVKDSTIYAEKQK